LGFRAPSFSVTKELLPWYYEALEAAGLRYSSSVFCGRTFLYGIEDFPYRIHQPAGDGWSTTIVEIPVTRVTMGPIATPVYFRLFPSWVLRRIVIRENCAGRPAVLYVHPREIDPDQPRLTLPPVTSFIHYFGVAGCEAKLQKLLTQVDGFTSIRDALSLEDADRSSQPVRAKDV
jgi:hypothetical protein